MVFIFSSAQSYYLYPDPPLAQCISVARCAVAFSNRRARPALLRPSISAAASAGELLRVRRPLELGRCLLFRLDRRRPPDVSLSAAECKLIFLFMFFLFFLQLNHIIFIPGRNFAPPSPPIPRPSTSPQEPPLPSSRNATTRTSGFVLEADPEKMGVAEPTQP